MRSESRGTVEDFFDLGLAATIKTYSFSWPVFYPLSLSNPISSEKLDIFMILHTTRIWDKLEAIRLFRAQAIDPPSDHHMKSHGKLSASVFFILLEIDTFLNE